MGKPALGRVTWIGLGLLASALAARAQDLDAGKTPAQLFSAHCTACHRTPQGLSKQTFGLAGFLRQHYTTSAATASALAAYVAAAGPDPRAARAPPDAQRGGTQAAPPPSTANGGDPRIPRDPAAATAAAPPPAGEASRPRARRDPRLAVAVSSDPQPFLILPDPIPVPPDSTPRRAALGAPSAPTETRPVLQDTAAVAPSATGAGGQASSEAMPSSDPAPTTTAGLAAGGVVAPAPDPPANAAADQPTFSAPLP